MINSVVSRFDGEIKHDKEIFKAVREGEVNPEPEEERDTTDAECNDAHKCFTVYRRKLPAAFWNSVGVDLASPEPKPVQLTGNKCLGEWIRVSKESPLINGKIEYYYTKPIHEQFADVTWAGLTSDAKKDD